MVSIPVRLFPATGSRDITFHMVHAVCHTRIRQLRWCPHCQREAPYAEIVRGYEYAPDQYVVLTEQDFDSIPVPGKHTIRLDAFVSESEIDPVYYERSYYLQPDEAGRKAFRLLTEALKTKSRAAVAVIALRERERPCVVRSFGESVLMLETLYYPDEVRASPQQEAPGPEVTKAEVDMALLLVDALSDSFSPERYHDKTRDALMEVIEAKLQGKQEFRSAAPEAPANIIDLTAALRASIESAKRARSAAPTAERRAS